MTSNLEARRKQTRYSLVQQRTAPNANKTDSHVPLAHNCAHLAKPISLWLNRCWAGRASRRGVWYGTVIPVWMCSQMWMINEFVRNRLITVTVMSCLMVRSRKLQRQSQKTIGSGRAAIVFAQTEKVCPTVIWPVTEMDTAVPHSITRGYRLLSLVCCWQSEAANKRKEGEQLLNDKWTTWEDTTLWTRAPRDVWFNWASSQHALIV